MLKTGIAFSVLLLVSGCSTLMGPPEDVTTQQTSQEQAENARLKAESAALRQALKQKKAELEAMKASTQSGAQ